MTTHPLSGRTRSLAALLTVAALVAAVPATVRTAAPAAEMRTTVAVLVSGAVEISPSLARLEAGRQMVSRGSVLTRDGRLRPAADLGTWARSRGYGPVSAELGDALAEGSAPDATTRAWTRCYEKGNGAAVICPDGYVEVN